MAYFSRRKLLLAGGASLAVLAGGAMAVLSREWDRSATAPTPGQTPSPMASAPSRLTFTRLANPDRTEVRNGHGKILAVLTDKARTALLKGPQRTLAEPQYTRAKVVTDAWVRLMPQEWSEGAEQATWFSGWFEAALADNSPDVLAIAMEYVYSAKSQKNAEGLQIAGDAAFGPLSDIDPDGRAENSDFYDYLGVPWTFPDGVRETPSPDRLRSLDCSGYLRMVYGYRLGYPLLGSNAGGAGLPRRANALATVGPGVQLMPNTGKPVRDLGLLQPGDLLFFQGVPEIDSDGPATNTHIEHAGIYLGVDDRGHHRFVSSRTTANGPTMGDAGGESILDGTGHFATKLRTARRL